MNCPNCGYNANPEGSAICNVCGASLLSASGGAYPQYAPVYQPVAAQPVQNNKRGVLIALIAIIAVAFVVFMLFATGVLDINSSKETSGGPSGKIDAGELGAAIAEYKKVDLVFLVDTTGSMGDDVDKLNADLAMYIAALKEKCTHDYRIALIDYRDFAGNTYYSDDYAYKVRLDFTNDTTKIYNAFGKLVLGYGGVDWEETAFSAMIDGGKKLSWRSDAAHIMVLISDAPAQDPEYKTGYTASDAKSYLKRNNILFFVIDSANDSEVKACFSPICSSSGGFYQGISRTAEMTDAMVEILDSASEYME